MDIGPYEVVAEVGRGGMGVVYKALDPHTHQALAIKVIQAGAHDPKRRIALVREAGITASLRHRHIVSIYDVGQHQGNLYFVMEYLSGASLASLETKRRPLSLKRRLLIIAQLCEALSYAHSQNVIHYDLKPANIFITSDWNTKVLDFGLTAISAVSSPGASRRIGTLPYMSPEQLRGMEVDGRSDIWSAGITLFELLAARRPFDGATAQQTVINILDAPLPQFSLTLPLAAEINAVLAGALHKDKTQRTPDAAVLAAELTKLSAVAATLQLPPVSISTPLVSQTEQLVSAGILPAPNISTNRPPDIRQFYQAADLQFTHTPAGEVLVTVAKFYLTPAEQVEYINRNKETWKMVLSALPFVAISALLGILFAIFLATVVTIFLGISEFGKSRRHAKAWPKCTACRSRMKLRREFHCHAKYNADVALGFRDCIEALKRSPWEDVAKLFTIHSVPFTPYVTLRNRLEFFECGACVEHVARLRTDELINGEHWITRPNIIEARHGLSGAKSAEHLAKPSI